MTGKPNKPDPVLDPWDVDLDAIPFVIDRGQEEHVRKMLAGDLPPEPAEGEGGSAG